MTAKLPYPVVLTGRHVRLEPLTPAHAPDLFEAAGGDEEVFRWIPVAIPGTPAEMVTNVTDRIEDPNCHPFAVIRLDTGRAVGISCYFDASDRDESLEIGGTWYGREVWRTAVNTESKLLLLTHAFEDLRMGRVCWKTDHLNERSQNAIKRLGARYEGTFRRSRQRRDGSWRDSVYFSMLVDEWPEAKERLTDRLAAG
ncbi:GNAT family N-acetyltransferase [Kitasatospora sp. NPDC101801]|uniref:GNAT family N-acetyltransferase n=1 Tax=Kitasatospora sp. NPDC101801 TaxID=3364103 RepID=UPI003805D725